MPDEIEDKKYDAILVDTSVFVSNGLRLESGLLEKLGQFKESPIDVVVPDVIRYEIVKHLEAAVSSTQSTLEKAIRRAYEQLVLPHHALAHALAALDTAPTHLEQAESRLSAFLEYVGALEVDCDAYVSVAHVLEKYFASQAPFSTSGKKKREFPDAIALMAVDDWAAKNDRQVLAIAKDRDWGRYCESSNRIDHCADFSAALASFHRATAPYTLMKRLKAAFESGEAYILLENVEEQIARKLRDEDVEQEADSRYYWEPGGASISLKQLRLIDHEPNLLEVKDEEIIVGIYTELTIDAEGSFSLSVWDSVDKEYVGLQTLTVWTENKFDTEILVPLKGDFGGDIDELEIGEVEIVDNINYIHFGELEPDWR